MRVLVATCATGDLNFTRMTNRMIQSLDWTQRDTPQHSIYFSITEQALEGYTRRCFDGRSISYKIDENKGFAWGMNKAIERGMQAFGFFDYVIVVNNDVEFLDIKWLTRLLEEHVGGMPRKVLVPLNTKCNTPCIVHPHAKDEAPFDLNFAPAVCWAVPQEAIVWMFMKYGYYLFDPDFKIGWAEDNFAAKQLNILLRQNAFRVVPRSWIHHEGSVTVNDMVKRHGVGFTKENERLLKEKQP